MKFVKYAFYILMALIVVAVSVGVYWFLLPTAMSNGDAEIALGLFVTVVWTLILFVIVGNVGQRLYTKYINPPQ